MYYLAKIIKEIEKNKDNKNFELNHNKIKFLTFANCTYSIIRALKRYYDFEEKTIKYEAQRNLDGKIYLQVSHPKVYFNFKRKEDVKLPFKNNTTGGG